MPLREVDVQLVVERIATSREAGLSLRQQTLLRFLVAEELAGRGERLKAYVIGTEALGRPETFDPETDSIVRAEMGRLRKALALYAATVGRDDPVRIALEPGNYQPRFVRPEPIEKPGPAAFSAGLYLDRLKQNSRGVLVAFSTIAAMVFAALALPGLMRKEAPVLLPLLDAPALTTASVTKPEPLIRPLIEVAPITVTASDPSAGTLGKAFTMELTSALANIGWVTVENGPAIDQHSENASPLRSRLEGMIQRQGEQIVATMQLGRDGFRLIEWSRRYAEPIGTADPLQVARQLADRIAVDIGRPFGVITSVTLRRLKDNDGSISSPAGCLMQLTAYWKFVGPRTRERVEKCIGDALVTNPDNSDMNAAMALILAERVDYIPMAREQLAELRRRIEEHLHAARRRGQASIVADTASLVIGLYRGDQKEFRAIAERTLEQQPHNMIVHAVYVLGLARTFGEWTDARAHFERYIVNNPDMPERLWLFPLEQALRDWRVEDAGHIARKAGRVRFPPLVLARLATAALRGEHELIDSEIVELADLGIGNLDSALMLARQARLSPEARSRIIDGVTRAFSIQQAN